MSLNHELGTTQCKWGIISSSWKWLSLSTKTSSFPICSNTTVQIWSESNFCTDCSSMCYTHDFVYVMLLIRQGIRASDSYLK